MAKSQAARVLVVDDEPELRQLLSDALGEPGLKVDVASSGKEALDLAALRRPDLVVADLRLGDCSGLDVIDRLRGQIGELPAVVITGYGDAQSLSEASRRRPVELMTKPLDLAQLRRTIRQELTRQADAKRTRKRTLRLRRLARTINLERKEAQQQLQTTCADLAEAYRALSAQLAVQQVAINYQRDLLASRTDDDVFRALFRLFVRRSGPVFGAALVCDANADLQIIGRFGVPGPDGAAFCQSLSQPMVDSVLANPRVTLIDAGEQAETFDPPIRKYLVGLSVLAIPLMPASGEMIGLVVLYRKGEQPFTEADVSLAEIISLPTAVAVKRND
ncbi:MAG TPA: response regulator [Phycisphaerae bacterium]|nr:response regulator [Phycisphaerae bacterium]HUT57488.1 response regulator [Phycisphaerae bacterium]